MLPGNIPYSLKETELLFYTQQINNHKAELSTLQSDWTSRLNSLQNQYDQEKTGTQDLQDQLEMMAEDNVNIERRLREIGEKEEMWKEKYRCVKYYVTIPQQGIHHIYSHRARGL